MSEVLKWVFRVSSVVILSQIVYYIEKYYKNKRKASDGKSSSTSMALFFPDYSLCCPYVYREDYHTKPLSFDVPNLFCSRYYCKFVHFPEDTKRVSPLRQMIKVLSSAKTSLDICLWIFSLQLLANVCIALHQNDICVRIVIDSREDETEKSQISRLRAMGIEVRFGPQMVNSGMFHHKFAVVDNTVLMTGSLNWTLSAIRKSCENVCITSRPQLVGPYVRRFDSYWKTFSANPTNVRRVATIN